MMDEVGFIETSYTNLTNGIVAIHSGYKFDWYNYKLIVMEANPYKNAINKLIAKAQVD